MKYATTHAYHVTGNAPPEPIRPAGPGWSLCGMTAIPCTSTAHIAIIYWAWVQKASP